MQAAISGYSRKRHGGSVRARRPMRPVRGIGGTRKVMALWLAAMMRATAMLSATSSFVFIDFVFCNIIHVSEVSSATAPMLQKSKGEKNSARSFMLQKLLPQQHPCCRKVKTDFFCKTIYVAKIPSATTPMLQKFVHNMLFCCKSFYVT